MQITEQSIINIYVAESLSEFSIGSKLLSVTIRDKDHDSRNLIFLNHTIGNIVFVRNVPI